MNAADAYNKVYRLINATCRKFRKRYGGDIEELISEANYAWLVALPKFDKSRSTLSTYTGRIVWYALLSRLRANSRHPILKKTEYNRCLQTIEDAKQSDYIAVLNPKAAQLVQIVRSKADEINQRVKQTPRLATKRLSHLRVLREMLQEMQWTASEIACAFREIKEVLQ